MKDFKCECGHMNPVGTQFCESCGKLIQDLPVDKPMDMRYEGTARRSIVNNRSVIDRIWMFFSSVKVAIVLIAATLVASSLGTIYPQAMYLPPGSDPSVHYEETYGLLGKIYYTLGFHELYSSWWYILLVASIGVSLVICSLDRVVPLHKALKNQRVTKHESFLRRQRLFTTVETASEEDIETVKTRLREKKYKVREENGNILAEKNRFSRWGPYVNHVGLIIFLIGAMLRYVPGMYIDQYMWVREGETKVVPETKGQLYIQNHDFIVELYDVDKEKDAFDPAIERVGNNSVPKNFQSDVTLLKKDENQLLGETANLEKVMDYSIVVNKPLKYEGFAIYQADFRKDDLYSMTFNLVDKKEGTVFGEFTVDLSNPEKEYELLNGYAVQVKDYFPDFYFNNEGAPDTKTRFPNNPSFVFTMTGPTIQGSEVAFIGIKENIEPSDKNTTAIKFAGIETRDASGFMVKKDLTLPILGIGGIIFMIGVIQGMYWNHRRLWITRSKGTYFVAAHTNKNWYGLTKECEMILKDTAFSRLKDVVQEDKK